MIKIMIDMRKKKEKILHIEIITMMIQAIIIIIPMTIQLNILIEIENLKEIEIEEIEIEKEIHGRDQIQKVLKINIK